MEARDADVQVAQAGRVARIGRMSLAQARLGDSDLLVTPLGIGLAAIARPGYMTLGRDADLPDRSVDALYARCVAVLDAATALGVRYVDVARSYGRAEEFVARWLAERSVAPGALTVGSKWGYRYTAGWRVDADVHEQKELSLERFTTQLAESRALLDGHLALYQIHSATVESGALDDQALIAALVAARQRGDFRALGLTLTGASARTTLERALALRLDGERVFDVVQATCNVLEPSLAAPLAAARAAGVGVIVKEVHANGRLTPANDRPGDAALRTRLEAIAARAGLASDQLAIAFVRAHGVADVVLSGAATTVQLASHAAAIDAPLDPATLAALGELRETPETYWRTRGALAWS